LSSNAHRADASAAHLVDAGAGEDFWADLVEQRVKLLMQRAAAQQRRYKTLQEWTGIPSDRWSAVALGRQRPTAEMLGALCRKFNELTLWLMTGKDDPRNKQWDLETFFARKELRLSAILEKPAGSELSIEEIYVLASSRQLATSLQDAERLECKRSLNEIDLLLESMPEHPENKAVAETPAWLALPKAANGSSNEQPSRKKKSLKPSNDSKN